MSSPQVTPDLGVVLVTYKSADDLPEFLESLPDAVGGFSYEVVAVDNASGDASADITEAAGAKQIRNTDNVGLTRALNQGAAATSAEWVLVVNPDTKLAEGSIAKLIGTAAADDRIGCVGPLVRSLDGADYPTGRRFPSVSIGIAHALLGPVWKGNPATRAYFGANQGGGDVDWVSGSCMLFRRSAFDAIGGYDTRYFMYFEETKICLDLHRAGWRVILESKAEIWRREGGSTRHAPFRKVYNHHRSALRFYCDYHRRSPWLVAAPLVALGLAARGGVSVLRTALSRKG